MKRIFPLIVSTLVFFTIAFPGFSQGKQTIVKKIKPIKGTYVKNKKLYIGKGYIGRLSSDRTMVVIAKMNNGGQVGGVSGTYRCFCKITNGSDKDDCQILSSGDMIDCYSEKDKCGSCIMYVTSRNGVALHAENKETDWEILKLD